MTPECRKQILGCHCRERSPAVTPKGQNPPGSEAQLASSRERGTDPLGSQVQTGSVTPLGRVAGVGRRGLCPVPCSPHRPQVLTWSRLRGPACTQVYSLPAHVSEGRARVPETQTVLQRLPGQQLCLGGGGS